MKLLVADDHALFRDALVCYIERSEPEAIVLIARDMNEVMEVMTGDPDLDLIMLDLGMPGMDGLSGLSKLKESCPEVPVALLSGLAEKEDVEEALRLGAVAYFPKTMSGRTMVKAIQETIDGNAYIARDYNTDDLMPSYQYNGYKEVYLQNNRKNLRVPSTGYSYKNQSDEVHLTPREKEVLSFLLDGASNKEIARALELQVVTIKLHVRSICKKLDAKNRTQAAMKAHEMGLVSVV